MCVVGHIDPEGLSLVPNKHHLWEMRGWGVTRNACNVAISFSWLTLPTKTFAYGRRVVFVRGRLLEGPFRRDVWESFSAKVQEKKYGIQKKISENKTKSKKK